MSGTSVAPRGVERFASLVSNWFEPGHWMMVLGPVVGWQAAGLTGGSWGLFAAFFTAIVPTVVLAWGASCGHWGDRSLRLRHERLVAAPAVLAPVIAGTVMLYVLGAPDEVGALVAAMLMVLVVLAGITTVWKVSVHSAVASAAVAVWVVTSGLWWMVAAAVVPLIGWSRVQLRCHTVAQVVVGVLVGAGVGGWAFGYLR
ncbi:hypothetical protein [Streptomyces sp. NPDC046161]|uniref:hypothetical protein n=1 Tax=Streptomyces sp. NPDC046161 TaxID=3155132 RepID=UPI0033DB4A7C